jgi:hypothetical protein
MPTIVANHDDSYLRNMLPFVFGEDGEKYFNLFARTYDHAEFCKNSYYDTNDISTFYEKYIKHFEFDSLFTETLEPNCYETDNIYDCGTVNEWYYFYKDGKLIRKIHLRFVQGIQLSFWLDRKVSY